VLAYNLFSFLVVTLTTESGFSTLEGTNIFPTYIGSTIFLNTFHNKHFSSSSYVECGSDGKDLSINMIILGERNKYRK